MATVGVAEHGSAAILVTLGRDGILADRRRVVLTEAGLPTHPHHHEGSWAVGRYRDSPWSRDLSLAEAVRLVERVRDSAARGARKGLSELAAAVSSPIGVIAIRACPKLPPSIEERIADNRAQLVADSVMYREALAEAAVSRGWTVCWYERRSVIDDAAVVLDCSDIASFLRRMGRPLGPPWQARHKLAAAAAIVAQRHAARGGRERS